MSDNEKSDFANEEAQFDTNNGEDEMLGETRWAAARDGDGDGLIPDTTTPRSDGEQEEEDQEEDVQAVPMIYDRNGEREDGTRLQNDLPDFANAENRKLNQKILKREVELERLEKSTVSEQERLKVMVSHLKNVEQELVHTQSFLTAKNNEARSEQHLNQLAARELGRTELDIAKIDGKKEEVLDQISTIQNKIYKNNEKLDEFKLAMNWNQEELEQWVLASRQKEEDNLAIQKYTRMDEVKIKELSLQIEKLTVLANEKSRTLEREVTETQAKQIELDKAAEEFRSLHIERQELVKRWQESIETMKRRDGEIQKSGQEFARVSAMSEEIEKVLVAENSRLEMIQQDNLDMDARAKIADRALQKHRSELVGHKEQHENVKAEVELMKIELREASNAVELKKKSLVTLQERLEESKAKLQLARKKFTDSKKRLDEERSETLTVDEMARASEEQIKHKETEVKLATKKLEVLKERMFKQGQELFQLRQRESNLKAEISGSRASNKNLASQIHKLDEESLHQQELVYTAEFQIQQLERKVARASGIRSDEEKKVLNQRIEECKAELEVVAHQNSVLITQMKKLQNDLRKTKRRETEVKIEKESLDKEIANLELESSSAEITLHKATKQREETLVQHDILKLEVRRLKELLSAKAGTVFSLENRKFQLEMSMQERKREIQVHQRVQRAKIKAAEEERHKVQLEVNKRRTKLDKLKAKHATLSNADSGEERSQAYFVIAAAQRREELQRTGDELDANIRKVQREVRALNVTLQKLNKRNTKHRASFHRVEQNAPEFAQLTRVEEQLNMAQSKSIKKRKALQQLESEINDEKQLMTQTQSQIALLDKHLMSLLDAKAQVTSELEEYVQKLDDTEAKVTKTGLEHRAAHGSDEAAPTNVENQFFAEALEDTCNSVLFTIGQLAKEFPEIKSTLTELLSRHGLNVQTAAPHGVNLVDENRNLSSTNASLAPTTA